jgi:transposase-like protein
VKRGGGIPSRSTCHKEGNEALVESSQIDPEDRHRQ